VRSARMNMKFYNKLDRFCAKNEKYGISNLMLYVVIGNVLVYLLSVMDRRGILLGLLTFNRSMIIKGQVWRLISYVIVPDVAYGTGSLLNAFLFAMMLYFYYSMGRILENHWGAMKMTLFYLSGTLLTSLFALLIGGYASPSYVNLTLFLAFATMYPDMQVYFFFFIPLKMKYLAYASLALEVLSMVGNLRVFPANLLPLAAIANYCLFFAPYLKDIFRKRSYRRENRDNVVNFKKAQKEAEKRQNASYRHKCAVCGRTDTEYPDLEFRYCSRCNGYYCYCEEHINTHVHNV